MTLEIVSDLAVIGGPCQGLVGDEPTSLTELENKILTSGTPFNLPGTQGLYRRDGEW